MACYFSLIGVLTWIVLVQPVFAQMNTLYLDNDISSWQLITDGVMGGVSKGALEVDDSGVKTCIAFTGSVRTDNNGGFIQIAHQIDKSLAHTAQQYEGIQIEVRGNGENYNIHLRTSGLWLPWQAFRATFHTDGNWQTIKLPFDSFEAYKTSQSLKVENLKRVAVVAIGRNFDADLCVASIGFYTEI